MAIISMKTIAWFYFMASVSSAVRLIAVGHKQNITMSQSYDTWTQQFNRSDVYSLRHAYAGDCLLIFGEMSGLTSAFVGSRGLASRNASTVIDAFLLLGETYLPQVGAYLLQYPGIQAVNAIELALSDVMWRSFVDTFSLLAVYYNAHIIAATIGPNIRVSTNQSEIDFFGDPDLNGTQTEVYLPAGPEVYNTAYLFAPNGSIIYDVHKVHLTGAEVATLALTPGQVSDNHVVPLPFGNVCIAICWDGFFADVVQHLDGQECEILTQPSYNDGKWGSYEPNSTIWQPLDWTSGSFGGLQSSLTANIQYWVNPMVTGNLMDMIVDGQSIITARSAANATFNTSDLYVGLLPSQLAAAPRNYSHVRVMAKAPWAFEDVTQDPLAVRRANLSHYAALLAPGSGSEFENQYADTAIFADI